MYACVFVSVCLFVCLITELALNNRSLLGHYTHTQKTPVNSCALLATIDLLGKGSNHVLCF